VKWWIFNLSSTPTKGSQSLQEISAQIHGREREERRNPNLLALQKCERYGKKFFCSGSREGNWRGACS